MRLTTFGRIGREFMSRNSEASRGIRELGWQLAAGDRRSRAFARYIFRDLARYAVSAPRPVEGETFQRAQLAARWLARAQDATSDGGLSHGYFPFRSASGWGQSYPEASGYTVPTLLAFAEAADEPEFRTRALRMATFTTQCQLPSGAIYGGVVRAVEERVPVAFNTGMALVGFLAAYCATGDRVFADCARKGARFLVDDIDADGYFRSHGPFVQYHHPLKTYTCLCAWPLYRAGELCGDERYCNAALRVGDAVLRQQHQNGWFTNNCLSHRVDAPLLHTIGYTLQGLLELGIASGRRKYVEATELGLERLLPCCDRGFLYGRWFADWQPASFSSCLTGAAQVAVVCYRQHEHTGDTRYRRAADTVLNYLKALQTTYAARWEDTEIVGAIGGSFPLIGAYMPNGFPGWATKFFLDALLLQLADQGSRPTAVTAESSNVVPV